ncbi:MAG: TlyA family rRNA (cytidine-2'-O)-methyltransferase [Candidatus Dormibacteraeota bacterium]|nr:TlyA family rRNA (cytidine-2'-O)-methyltransferase [Candidatus Dormibacteraeota bacterium]
MRRPRRQTLALPPRQPLRGEAKLRAALDAFGVDPTGKVALDVGAAAGGFTTALLAAGARLVYAVDAGHGQLLGSLRQDPRVVNLEATNVALLDTRLVPDSVELVTVDVSYLALAEAVRQLDRVGFATGAELVGLVKPMFELRLATAPVDLASVEAAIRAAAEGVEHAGWQVLATIPSPVTGARGAREALLFAVRKPGLIPPTA